MQFAKQCLFGFLAFRNAALWKLPSSTAGASTNKYLTIIADQHDPDIGAKTMHIDKVTHKFDDCFTGAYSAAIKTPQKQEFVCSYECFAYACANESTRFHLFA